MWTNEHEIKDAAERYALHPVLGPATQTLVNLVQWTNANSDGWPYWTKPAKAADKLMDLVGGYLDYVSNPERPDATMEAYRLALRPLKAFRTRIGKTMQDLFEIIDREGGPIWLAELEYARAQARYEQHAAFTASLLETVRAASAKLDELRAREELRMLNARLAAGEELDEHLTVLARFKDGDLLYRTPHFGSTGFDGLGYVVRVVGLSYGASGARLSCVAVESGQRCLVHHYPLALADARQRWWILDAEAENLVSGGLADRARVEASAAQKHPGCIVRQGCEFIPES
jgi:hypothetical protein